MKGPPARRGRPLTNLYDLIVKDIKEVGYTFDKMEDFYQPQELALYPDQWDKL